MNNITDKNTNMSTPQYQPPAVASQPYPSSVAPSTVALNYLASLMGVSPAELEQKAEYETGMHTAALKLLDNLRDDYVRLSRKIRGDTAHSTSLLESLQLVKESDGAGDKAKAIFAAADNAVGKIPVIGHVKRYVQNRLFADSLHVGKALEHELQTVQNLHTKLGAFLFGDTESLRAMYETLTQTIESYTQKTFETKENIEHTMEAIAQIQEQMTQERKGLEATLGYQYEQINPETLTAEQFMTYSDIEKLNWQLTTQEQNLQKFQHDQGILLTAIAGKKVTIFTMAGYQVAGTETYRAIDEFLKNASEDVSALARLSRVESVIVQASTQAQLLRTHFNGLLALTAEHGAMILERGSDLVPDSIYDLSTLALALDRIKDGVEAYSQRKGIPPPENFEDNLTQLTENAQKPQSILPTKIGR